MNVMYILQNQKRIKCSLLLKFSNFIFSRKVPCLQDVLLVLQATSLQDALDDVVGMVVLSSWDGAAVIS